MQSTMHSWVSGHRKKEGQEGRLLIHTTRGLGTTQLCLETIYKRLFNIRSRLQVSKLRQIRCHSMQGDERPQNPPALTFWTLSQPLCASHMLKGTKPICSNFSLRITVITPCYSFNFTTSNIMEKLHFTQRTIWAIENKSTVPTSHFLRNQVLSLKPCQGLFDSSHFHKKR